MSRSNERSGNDLLPTVREWDAETGQFLRVIEGGGDAASSSPEPPRSPWRAVARGLETVVEPAEGGAPVAWLPVSLEYVTSHLDGRVWAGASGSHVYIVRLEDAPER